MITDKEAAELVDELRLGVEGNLSYQEKIEIHQLYTQGKIGEEVTRILIGSELDDIVRERDAFEDAMELDMDGVFQE